MGEAILRVVVLGRLGLAGASPPPGIALEVVVPGAPLPPAEVYVLPFRQGKEAWGELAALRAAGVVAAPEARDARTPLTLLWAVHPEANPAPFAPFVDATLLGGGGARLMAWLERLRAGWDVGRPERLAGLAEVGGLLLEETRGRVTAWPPEGPAETGPPRALPPPEAADRSLTPEGLLALEPGHPDPAVQAALGSPLGAAEVGAFAAGAVGHGLRRLILHFRIGLGADEARALAAWCRRCRHEIVHRLRDDRRAPPITVRVACFVPRPWTPFQWMGMAPLETLAATLRRLREEGRGLGWLTLTADLPKWARIEALLARGDRRVAETVRLALRDGDWERALIESPWNPAWFVHRPRPRDEAFPWDPLDWGLDRDALWRQYEAFRAATGRPA